MQREVEEHIQSLSDIDLLEYTRSDTYLPEAIKFAKEELARRNLTSEHLAALEEELQNRTKAQAEETQAAATEPLPFEWRLAVFLCGLCLGIPLLFFIPAWLRFREEGARRKNRDMWLFALAGVGLQAIAVFLRIPPWSWLVALFSTYNQVP